MLLLRFGCASPGVQVAASNFVLRTTTVATELRLSSASLRLECSLSTWEGFETSTRQETVSVPLEVVRRRESGVDMHHVSSADAERRSPFSIPAGSSALEYHFKIKRNRSTAFCDIKGARTFDIGCAAATLQ